MEFHPPQWRRPQWGPATVLGAGGCGSCNGSDASFSGDPETAGLGFALAPPHDLSSDHGRLPVDGTDHPFVLTSTGEVVYVETDFTIKGVGFDFHWTRTYRSAYEYSGEMGYGWDYSAQLFLVENSAGDKVTAYLGDGRITDKYEWDSQASSWTSPDGFFDQLTEGTRSGSHPEFPNGPYFKKTEKNGVYWEFDRVYDGVKDWYGCTKIADPWGNEITFEYDYDQGGNAFLDKITDTEGREVTFTRSSGRITQVTVSDSSVHADYGNITIDYEYTSDRLTKVTLHKTRKSDGGTVVRPYSEYTYYTSGDRDNNLDLVKDSGTTVLDFDYANDPEDRCTKVTEADGLVHEYLHDQGDVNDDWCQYTDPSDQRVDFVYTDLAGDDRTIKERRDHLEDHNGNTLTGTYDTKYTRDCDCGRVTEIEYSDGSKEKYDYDSYGNLTKYTRTSSDGNDDDLVKKWTYDSFANYSRMLTTSGWLRAETNPSSKVTYTWDVNGLLDDVTWPTVTSGQPSSQTIKWEYSFNADGTLDTLTKPNGDELEWTYSTNGTTGVLTLIRTDDPDSGGLQREWEDQFDLAGNLISREDPTGAVWTNTMTPDGRLLKVAGPNGQEVKYEYDLRGRRTKTDKLLVDDSSDTRVVTVFTVSDRGWNTQVKADDGGINATTDFVFEEAEGSRYKETIGPDDHGVKSVWGYGSHNAPWKKYNVDDSGVSRVETLIEELERDTMGRVTARESQGGTRTEYEYDGYGRLTTATTDLPNSKERITTRTLKDWGGVEKIEVKVGATVHAETNYYYDEAIRLYKTVQEDPESVIADRVVEVELDQNGRAHKLKDALGETSEFQWDAVGRIKKKIDPIGNEVQYAYDDTSRTTTVTYHDKDTSDSTFTDYDVIETRDASGRITSVKDEGSASGNRTTTFEYDEGGRRTKMTLPEGGDREWEYDNLGRMTKETSDIDGSTTAVSTFTISSGGQRTKVKDANNVETEWTFDSFDREATVKFNGDANQVYTRTYDSYGRLATVEDPLGVEIDYSYDAGGRLTQVDIDKNSSGLGGPDRIVLAYDDMDRPTSGKTQDYNGSTYDDVVTITRAYDGYGRLESETQHGSRTVSYDYDLAGNLTELTYPSGGPVVGVKYSYDAAGRVEKVERKLSTDVEGVTTSQWEDTALFEFEGQREIERIQDPYDLERTQTWTSFREPKILKYEKDSTSTLLTGLESYWDKNRRPVARIRSHDGNAYDWGEVFRYDDMNRFTKLWTNVQDPANFLTTDPTDASHTFDDRITYTMGKVYERDNVKTKPDGGTETTVEYTNNNFYQYTSIGGQTHTWDDNGHLTDNGPWAFDWTALGQLAQADPDTGTTRDYVYDAFGRRVKTSVGSDDYEYLYHGWHMIGEHDGTDWLWQEVPLPGEGMLEHIALDSNDIDDDSDTTEYRPYAVHEDHQHTVHGLSDASGDPVERFRYRDPFGSTYTEQWDGENWSDIGDFASEVFHVKRLHGGVVDPASELYDFRKRWLAPETGSWLSRDPLGQVDSWNLYEGFLADPLTGSDRMGMARAYEKIEANIYCGDIPWLTAIAKIFTPGPLSNSARHCLLHCKKTLYEGYWVRGETTWTHVWRETVIYDFTVGVLRGGKMTYEDVFGREHTARRAVEGKNHDFDRDIVDSCGSFWSNCTKHPVSDKPYDSSNPPPENWDPSSAPGMLCENINGLGPNTAPKPRSPVYRAETGPNSNTYIRDLLQGAKCYTKTPLVVGWFYEYKVEDFPQ